MTGRNDEASFGAGIVMGLPDSDLLALLNVAEVEANRRSLRQPPPDLERVWTEHQEAPEHFREDNDAVVAPFEPDTNSRTRAASGGRP